jgi:hypothetical protein
MAVFSRLENSQRILWFQRFLFPLQRKLGMFFFWMLMLSEIFFIFWLNFQRFFSALCSPTWFRHFWVEIKNPYRLLCKHWYSVVCFCCTDQCYCIYLVWRSNSSCMLLFVRTCVLCFFDMTTVILMPFIPYLVKFLLNVI